MPSTAASLDAEARLALAEFDVGAVLGVEPLPAGSPAGRKVTTSTGGYILKPAYRAADVELQAEVARLLSPLGVRQAQVVRTRAGHVVTGSGYLLLEFLPGSAHLDPTSAQVTAAMRHVAGFHLLLGQLPVRYRPDPASVWERVASPGFLVAELPELLRRYGLAPDETITAIGYLDRARTGLAALPRQLVHGDIGPDNVLMDGDDVVSVVDFTPHFEPVLFAASTALYWYHVAGRPAVSCAQLRASLAAMAEVRPWTDGELALWPAGLVREALRRLATPLELARVSGGRPGPSAPARLTALKAVVRILPELTAGPPGLR